nr:hypothetical protein [Tanacetum cinerariifolium]
QGDAAAAAAAGVRGRVYHIAQHVHGFAAVVEHAVEQIQLARRGHGKRRARPRQRERARRLINRPVVKRVGRGPNGAVVGQQLVLPPAEGGGVVARQVRAPRGNRERTLDGYVLRVGAERGRDGARSVDKKVVEHRERLRRQRGAIGVSARRKVAVNRQGAQDSLAGARR